VVGVALLVEPRFVEATKSAQGVCQENRAAELPLRCVITHRGRYWTPAEPIP